MWRGAKLQGAEHTAEAIFHFRRTVPGNLECLVHDLRRMVPDRARGQFVAITDDVVLVAKDVQRRLTFQGFQTSLRHGKGIMRKIDLLFRLVPFVHWVVHDPTKPIGILFY